MILGANIIGTTNVADMCFSGASQFGRNGPVLNPRDKQQTSAGSSAGSGVVVCNNTKFNHNRGKI